MAANTAVSTWNEEREEVWQSVAGAMRSPDLNDDRASACRYLVRHLSAFGQDRREPHPAARGLRSRSLRRSAAEGSSR